MSVGLSALSYVGTGTATGGVLVQGTATVSPNSSTLAGDLVVAVVYVTNLDATVNLSDNGQPWVIFAGSNGSQSVALAILVAPRSGSSGYSLYLGAQSTALGIQVGTYRVAGAKFDIGRAVGSIAVINTSSSTALDAPAHGMNYPQGLDIIGRVYNTGGTATTAGNITGFTERFDTSYGTASAGLVLNERQVFNLLPCPSVTSALAVAKDYRMGIRAFVPLIGNTLFRGRLQGNRRILG